MRASRRRVVVASAPSFLLLALFYSLAFHMQRGLGGWPASIGERGFPPLLIIHANITVHYYLASFVCTFIVVPVAIVACLLVPRWKHCVTYFAGCGFFFFIAWYLMLLAPGPFLDWWRD